ncbi:Six-bladed beta-propeller, TolB-like [Sergentomyia squamirostris]
MKSVQLCVLVTVLLCIHGTLAFVEVYNWKQVEFQNLPLQEDAYIGNYPYYIPENNALSGFSHYAPGKLSIVTIARVRPGVPSTLNAFCHDDYKKGSSPRLFGFPNFQKNTLKPNCYNATSHFDGRKYHNSKPYFSSDDDYTLVSVIVPSIHQECDRFYAVDTGVLEYGPSGSYKVQSPAIIIYQLSPNVCSTRQIPLINRVDIPNHVYKNPAGFHRINVDPDPKGSCDDVYYYLPNIYDNRLVVCDYKRGEFWYLTDETMNPVYAESHMSYNGFQYTFPAGISVVNVGSADKDGNANAYYAPIASYGLYATNTKLLKDNKRSYKVGWTDFITLGYRGCDRTSLTQNLDGATGIMFIQQMQFKQVRCWNTKHHLNSDNIGVVYQADDLDFVSDIAFDADGYVWLLSGKFLKQYLTDVPLTYVSKLYRAKVTEIVRGTVCGA